LKIHLSADHRGWDLAKDLETWLTESGHEVIWHGPSFKDEGDDYPVFTIRAAQAQVTDEDTGTAAKAIVVAGDGSGETIAANKVSGARATMALNAKQVELARKHADASLLVIGSLHHGAEQAKALIEIFLTTKFGNLLEDARRIINTTEYENSKTIEGWLIGFEG